MKKITVLISFFMLSACTMLYAQDSKYKAKYLVNLINYMNWADDPITIGVIGNSPVLIELENLIAQNPKIKLKKISDGEMITNCNLIFLPDPQTRNFKLIQGKIGGSPIVLVAENEDLITQGAEMVFYKENNRLKFAINKSAIDATGIEVSNKLMAQVRVVN